MAHDMFLVMRWTCKMLLRWRGLDCSFELIIVSPIWEIDNWENKGYA